AVHAIEQPVALPIEGAFDLQRRKFVRHHPQVPAGAVGPLPLWRNASTSGGVICSRPVQKGQNCSPITVGRSRRKSLGRLRRSVEIITQRPVTASFLSSGILVVDVHESRTLRG